MKDSGLQKKESVTNRSKKYQNLPTQENEEEEFHHRGSIITDKENVFED